MSLYVDRKYLLLISNHLRNFKQKNQDLWNFSCPICGDSKKNTLKARGYVYEHKNKYFYSCHNCGHSTSFSHLLKFIDPISHKNYVMEKFKNRNDKKKEVFSPKTTTTFVEKEISLPSINDLPEDHYAKQYIVGRKIPKERWGEIFFAEDFKKFMDEKFPNHGKDKLQENDPRIILYYTDINGKITHVGSRALVPEQKIRYLTVKVSDVDRKMFGISHVKFDKTIYILEGQFDSMFIDNAIASGDSSLDALANSLKSNIQEKIDTVLVYDNEKRNKEIVRQIKWAIEGNHKVVIWPDDTIGKDINDMVKDGHYTREQIMEIIRSNTYQGLSAELRFASWRKC